MNNGWLNLALVEINKNLKRVDVSMDQIIFMHKYHSLNQVSKERFYCLKRQFSMLDQIIVKRFRAVLKNQTNFVSYLKFSEDTYYLRMDDIG